MPAETLVRLLNDHDLHLLRSTHSDTPSEPPRIAADTILKLLIDLYTHQDSLIWPRIPYLSTISAATWGGMYFLAAGNPPHPCLAILVGAVGIVFTFALFGTVHGAMQNRNVNLELIDALLRHHLDPSVMERMQQHAQSKKGSKLLLLDVPKPVRDRLHRWVPARGLFTCSFIISMLITAGLMLFIWMGSVPASRCVFTGFLNSVPGYVWY